MEALPQYFSNNNIQSSCSCFLMSKPCQCCNWWITADHNDKMLQLFHFAETDSRKEPKADEKLRSGKIWTFAIVHRNFILIYIPSLFVPKVIHFDVLLSATSIEYQNFNYFQWMENSVCQSQRIYFHNIKWPVSLHGVVIDICWLNSHIFKCWQYIGHWWLPTHVLIRRLRLSMVSHDTYLPLCFKDIFYAWSVVFCVLSEGQSSLY